MTGPGAGSGGSVAAEIEALYRSHSRRVLATLIRMLGDFAIIHARTSYQKPDGTQGGGRYTDDWQLRGGRWQCVSAHVTRL